MSAKGKASMVLGAAGMFGLALYQLSTGQYVAAGQSVLAALGLLHVHGRVTELLAEFLPDSGK